MTRPSLSRVVAYLVLPTVVLVAALGVGYLKWQASSVTATQAASAQSVSAATDAVTAMLSYRAGHVEQDLTAASERMTGDFRSEYTALMHDVVIPGANEKRISAVATVPAAASLSASPDRAEVLLYINQTTTVGDDAPTATTSSAQVLVERVGNQWLIADFTPV